MAEACARLGWCAAFIGQGFRRILSGSLPAIGGAVIVLLTMVVCTLDDVCRSLAQRFQDDVKEYGSAAAAGAWALVRPRRTRTAWQNFPKLPQQVFCALGAAESMAVTVGPECGELESRLRQRLLDGGGVGLCHEWSGGSGDSGGGRKLWQLSKDRTVQDCHQRSIRENIKGSRSPGYGGLGTLKDMADRLEGLARRSGGLRQHRGCRPIRRLNHKGETQGTRRRVHCRGADCGAWEWICRCAHPIRDRPKRFVELRSSEGSGIRKGGRQMSQRSGGGL